MNGDETAELRCLADQLRGLLREAVFFSRRMDAGTELSTPQLSLLNMLDGRDLRVGKIAANLGVRMPTATEAIKRLEAHGLVRRQADPGDSRAVIVVRTEVGAQASDRDNARRNELVAVLLRQLPEEDRERLRQAFPVIEKINMLQQKTIESKGIMNTSTA